MKNLLILLAVLISVQSFSQIYMSKNKFVVFNKFKVESDYDARARLTSLDKVTSKTDYKVQFSDSTLITCKLTWYVNPNTWKVRLKLYPISVTTQRIGSEKIDIEDIQKAYVFGKNDTLFHTFRENVKVLLSEIEGIVKHDLDVDYFVKKQEVKDYELKKMLPLEERLTNLEHKLSLSGEELQKFPRRYFAGLSTSGVGVGLVVIGMMTSPISLPLALVGCAVIGVGQIISIVSHKKVYDASKILLSK